MSILSDKWIRQSAWETGMIEPFVESQKREGIISYGLSSYGYDARVSDEFKIFTNIDSATSQAQVSSIAKQMSVSFRPIHLF